MTEPKTPRRPEEFSGEVRDFAYKQFVAWYAIPKNVSKKDTGGIPLTIEKFSDDYDIPLETLYDFMQHQTFHKDVRKKTFEWLRTRLPETIGSLYNKISTDKSSEDLRQMLKLLEDYTKAEVETEPIPLYMDDTRYESLIRREAIRLNIVGPQTSR